MQSQGLRPLLNRHPFAGRPNRSWLAGLAALGIGAFMVGGWMAAIAVLVAVRLGQSLRRGIARSGGPGGTLGLI